jgi:hypothetical protein
MKRVGFDPQRGKSVLDFNADHWKRPSRYSRAFDLDSGPFSFPGRREGPARGRQVKLWLSVTTGAVAFWASRPARSAGRASSYRDFRWRSAETR